jgi:hypothetical protein
MPWQGRRRFSIAHPSIPSRWEGKKYQLSNDLLSPSRGEGARGWAIQFRPSLCPSTDILYAMDISWCHDPRPCNTALTIPGTGFSTLRDTLSRRSSKAPFVL